VYKESETQMSRSGKCILWRVGWTTWRQTAQIV